MSRPAKRYLLVAGVLLGLAVICAGYKCRHKILARVKHMFKSSPGVQAAPVSVLEISGRKFPNVLGCPPYYLEVKPLDSVLFVTKVNAGGSNLFHVLNLKSGADMQIPTIADFGRNIGLVGSGTRDYIALAEPGMVVAATETRIRGMNRTLYYLNLETSKMEARDLFQYNSNGYMSNRVRLPGF